MDDEWQDDLWDYTQGGDLYDEDEYAGDEPREEREDEGGDDEAFTEEQPEGGDDDDMEFGTDYKHLQQIAHERRTTLGTTGGLSEGLQKAQRTPEEATLDQVEGVLSSSYSEISETLRQRIISLVEKIKGVYLYNVDVLVLAAIWTVEGKELNKKNLQVFLTKYKGKTEISSLDLVRYIRALGIN